MRIAILTSSRADYGIYLPLLKKLKKEPFFNLSLIVFGTHLSVSHGNTFKEIEKDGFEIEFKLNTVPEFDSPGAISDAIGETIKLFSKFWMQQKDEFDLVFCLGDRYEMFAAVVAGIPLQIAFAHIHGGETTLGAIDNVFRHSITLASKFHFAATAMSAARVKELISTNENVYNVGSLSLDNLKKLNLLTIDEFKVKWGIDLSKSTILTTFHPETVAMNKNELFTGELIIALKSLTGYQVLITMPNADTLGSSVRRKLIEEFQYSEHVFLIENLGSQSYFTAMKFCSYMLGNTSSGIIEASSFGKYVINIGDRQKGRESGPNVIHTPIDAHAILQTVKDIETFPNLRSVNIYYNGGAADKVIEVLHSTYIN
ncbi:UDP-N-acetylglucosamine 2-epimerase [Daejeonella sp.]|uniref:UDP-N-acetylglucosamine 2-epimerase n=1 Tax=Daejeonella sp. TaxID=2805397 RepID=UPI0030C622CD